MALRLVQVIIDNEDGLDIENNLDESTYHTTWVSESLGQKQVISVLVDAEMSETVLDTLEDNLSAQNYRVLVYPIEATLPRPEKEEEESQGANGESGEENAKEEAKPRISREELYNDVWDATALSWPFLALTIMSVVVAAFGLIHDETAVVIGAMVIAPLLGPNVALALGTTLADTALIRLSLKANVAGVGTALVLSLTLGLVLPVDPDVPSLAARSVVRWDHMLLALAAGGAGALAFTRGAPAALVGVMVAVALVPPLVAFGLLLASGYYSRSLGALLMLSVNIICVNFAGVVTFLAQGIRPRTWWEKDKATRANRIAIAIWAALLAVLGALMWAAERYLWIE